MKALQERFSARRRLVLLSTAFVALVIGWMAATQPFGAPDEPWHYLRAMSIRNGQLLGKKVLYGPVPWLTRTQQAFINHDTRAVEVPAQLSIKNSACIAPGSNAVWPPGIADTAGGCLVGTPNGNFPPIGYLLPGVLLTAAHHTSSALWLTRAASAAQSLAFLVLALVLLWSGTSWSLIGILAAISPMVLFVSSVMNSSGLQIASSLAFAAALLRISRDPPGARRWVWVACAISGVVSILTGPIGIVFGIAELAVFAGLVGYRGTRELLRTRRRPTLIASAVLILAAAVALIYSKIAGFAHHFGITPFWHSLHVAVTQQFPEVMRESVGSFGSANVPLPAGPVWIWWALVVVLIAGALRLGNRRERVLVVAVTVLALVFPILFWAWVDRYTGFGLQGREILPILQLIPLTAGEVVYRHSASLARARTARLALAAGIGLVGVLQAYSWWFSARVAAAQPGTIRFYAHAVWSPPGGWAPWIASAALGTVALLTYAAGEALPEPLAIGRRLAASRDVKAS